MQRILIILSLFILIANGTMPAQWQVLTSPRNQSMTATYFISSDTGFVISANDCFRTTNGGLQWSRTGPGGNSIYFASKTLGFIAGKNILRSTDGGNTWRTVHNHPRRDEFNEAMNTYKAISFKDELHGVAAGYCWACRASVTTNDGGETWLDTLPYHVFPPQGDCRVVAVSSNGTRYLGCWTIAEWLQFTELFSRRSESDWWSLVDGWNLHIGSSWFIAKTMYWHGEKQGWIGGHKKAPQRTPPYPYYNVRVLFTTDAGETWDSTKYVFPYTVNTITFADELRGFIGDTAGNIYSTTDGGTTWKNDNVPSDGRSINSISIAGGSRVFAVGDGGLILRHDLPVSVQEANTSPPLLIYPNPTTGRVRIDIGDAEPAVVTVVDMMGRVQNITLVSDNEIDVGMLTTGTYVVLVRRGAQVSTELMVKAGE